jgi:hypothetical protein
MTHKAPDDDANEKFGFMNFSGQFVVLSDYFSAASDDQLDNKGLADSVRSLAVTGSTRESLRQLSVLSHFAHKPSDQLEVVQAYSESLDDEVRPRFDALPEGWRVFGTQPVLKAIAAVMMEIDSTRRYPSQGMMHSAILLTHSVGEQLQRHERIHSSGKLIGGLDEELVLTHVAAVSLYYTQLPNVMLLRQEQLWERYGHLASQHFDGKSATDLLREATGLDLLEILALGSFLNIASVDWAKFGGLTNRLGGFSGISREKVARFEALVSLTAAGFKEKIEDAPESTWDLSVFEEYPVVKIYDDLLVLDESLLWRRITTGLYWFVFDHLKRTRGKSGWRLWTQAWGDIVEAAVLDLLTPFANVDEFGKSIIWDEHDLEQVYGSDVKHADFVLVVGSNLLVVEVVSGQLTVGTRSKLDRQAFDSDIEKLFTKKARQLDETIGCIEEGAAALLGHDLPEDWKVIPIIVAAFGFPFFKPVISHVNAVAAREGLLQSPRIERFCILDLREIELLESAAEQGQNVGESLVTWQRDAGSEITYWNWYTTVNYGTAEIPTRLQEGGKDQIQRIIRTLSGDVDLGTPMM